MLVRRNVALWAAAAAGLPPAMGVGLASVAPHLADAHTGVWTMRPLLEILVILFFLACAALVASGGLDALWWARGRPGLGRGHWASLLGGTALLFLLLILLTLGDALVVPIGR